MRVRRRVVSHGTRVFVAGAFAGLLVALLIGGIGYGQDCLTGRQVQRSWSFTWTQPVPYLLPPEPAADCVVHSGTRVALNAVGIARYEPPRVDRVTVRQAA